MPDRDLPAGFGRLLLPALASLRLRHLADADIDGPPVHALIPLGHRMPAKTRVVLDHLADSLKPSGS